MRDQPHISEHEEMEDAKEARIEELENVVKEAKTKLKKIAGAMWNGPEFPGEVKIDYTSDIEEVIDVLERA